METVLAIDNQVKTVKKIHMTEDVWFSNFIEIGFMLVKSLNVINAPLLHLDRSVGLHPYKSTLTSFLPLKCYKTLNSSYFNIRVPSIVLGTEIKFMSYRPHFTDKKTKNSTGFLNN